MSARTKIGKEVDDAAILKARLAEAIRLLKALDPADVDAPWFTEYVQRSWARARNAFLEDLDV